MLIDPIYMRIDKNGRIYVDRDLAEQEALIIVVKPIPQDKIDYIKVGRRGLLKTYSNEAFAYIPFL